MAELHELHSALGALMHSGKTAKVSFYYLGDDAKMQGGSIAVEHGTDCYISFQQQPPEAALEEIARLRFAKITTLPAMPADHAGDSASAVAIAIVLDRLDPGKLPQPAPPPVIELPARAVEEEPAARQAHVFYSHLAMQKDALDLLQPLFGVGAAKKVEEFARTSPPHQHPVDFLTKCRQHAAMMLGAKKAEELFKPIFEKLSH